MGMVKRKMMEVQEEAFAAYDAAEEENPNPYVGTIWERTWQEAWDGRQDTYAEHLDRLAEAEGYYR